jgi:hypothetical protein
MLIPDPDTITAAVQAQTAHLASVRWRYIGNDAANHDILNRLTVRTRHRCNLLPEESTTLVHLGFIATGLAAVFQFPSHRTMFIP